MQLLISNEQQETPVNEDLHSLLRRALEEVLATEPHPSGIRLRTWTRPDWRARQTASPNEGGHLPGAPPEAGLRERAAAATKGR